MTDRELQRNVEDALAWEPSFDAASVGVTVENGVVTLRGPVNSPQEKASIDAKAQQIAGATKVKNELEIVAN